MPIFNGHQDYWAFNHIYGSFVVTNSMATAVKEVVIVNLGPGRSSMEISFFMICKFSSAKISCWMPFLIQPSPFIQAWVPAWDYTAK